MKKLLKEFRNFAVKGSVMDMTIGVIIGGAFGKVVSSIVTDILMPPIGFLTGGVDFSSLVITLKSATETDPAVTINYGLFINSLVDFLIISLTIFLLIRGLNKLRKKEESKPTEPSEEVLLLREIRDLLKKK